MGIFSVLAPIAGSLISGALSKKSASDTNQANSAVNLQQMAFNREEAEKQRAYATTQSDIDRAYNKTAATTAYGRSKYLANTAHQRQVKDLSAAGLNPILSARYGGSATPPVASPTSKAGQGATASAGSLKAMVDSGNIGLEMGLKTMLANSQVALQNAQAGQATAQAGQTDANTDLLKIDKYSRHRTNITQNQLRDAQANLADWAAKTERYKPRVLRAQVWHLRSGAAGNWAKAAWQKTSDLVLKQELKRARVFGAMWTKNPTISSGLAYLQEGSKAGLSLDKMLSAMASVIPIKFLSSLIDKIPVKTIIGKATSMIR